MQPANNTQANVGIQEAPTQVKSSFRNILGNVVSMISHDIALRAATFVLYLLVGRYLGAYEFGQMSLALSLFYTFQVIAVAGLKVLITRKVTTDPASTNRYLVNGSLIALIASLFSMLLLVAFVRLLNYSEDTISVIMLMALSLLPYGLSSVCEAIFQAWEQMHYIAYVSVGVNLVKIALAYVFLAQGYGLYAIILLLFLCHTAVLLLNWGIIGWRITRPQLRIEWRFILKTVREVIPFLGIYGLLAVKSSLNVVLLSKMGSEVETGLYSAAIQLTLPIFLILESVALALFPVMCRRFGSGVQALKQVSEDTISLLLILALPAAVGLFLMPDSILVFVYGGQDFAGAASALHIIAWVLIIRVFTHVLGRALWASQKETKSLQIILVDTVIWFVLGMVLISQFGLVGAAMTLLLSEIINFFLHYIPVSKMLFRISLVKVAWKPIVASLCMGLYLFAFGDHGVIWTILSGAGVYITVILMLEIWVLGGTKQLKAKYLNMWSE
jgi:O-antigen/teichoic acid export membrane protein